MFSCLSLTISAAILYFVLRYRVHVHVSYTPRRRAARPAQSSRRTSRCMPEEVRPVQSPAVPSPVRQKDLESALRNLGCKPAQAKEAAGRAMFHQDPEFPAALRRAIDYASRSNAA